jgi:hypothetical protein
MTPCVENRLSRGKKKDAKGEVGRDKLRMDKLMGQFC